MNIYFLAFPEYEEGVPDSSETEETESLDDGETLEENEIDSPEEEEDIIMETESFTLSDIHKDINILSYGVCIPLCFIALYIVIRDLFRVGI